MRKPQCGDRVEILWEDREISFPATLHTRHGHRAWIFDVNYDDGDQLVEDMDNVLWRYLPDGIWHEPGEIAQLEREDGDCAFSAANLPGKRRKSDPQGGVAKNLPPRVARATRQNSAANAD